MRRTDATTPEQEYDAYSNAANHQPHGAPRRRHAPAGIGAPQEDASEAGRGTHGADAEEVPETAPPSVQFGRERQAFRQRWAVVIAFVMWCLVQWVTHGSPGMVAAGLVVAAIAHWSGKDLDHAARIEPGVAVLRTGGDEAHVPADEVTDIRVEETPGLLTRSVYISIERGRFDQFDILRAKAPDTPEGRARLQAQADEALEILRSDPARLV